MTDIDNCIFCQEIQQPNTSADINPISNRLLFETKNFLIFPTIGQFTEGYLLIASKKHYPSVAYLPIGQFNELRKIIDSTRKILEKHYQSAIFFEHGAIESQKGGCCIDHLHIHALPCKTSLLKEIGRHFKAQKIDNLKQITKQVTNSKSYLFYQNNRRENYIFDVNVIPSQYLRKMISAKLSVPKLWDWRIFPELERLEKTYNNLKPIFAKLKQS